MSKKYYHVQPQNGPGFETLIDLRKHTEIMADLLLKFPGFTSISEIEDQELESSIIELVGQDVDKFVDIPWTTYDDEKTFKILQLLTNVQYNHGTADMLIDGDNMLDYYKGFVVDPDDELEEFDDDNCSVWDYTVSFK